MTERSRPAMISYCTAILNRRHQLAETLRCNLDIAQKSDACVEFVVLDFGSNDGLAEWIAGNFSRELHSEYLRFVREPEARAWHASKAKNACHRIARGEIVANLDADNFLHEGEPELMLRLFRENGPHAVLSQWSGTFQDGSFGRISTTRAAFDAVGGYDETLEPMGEQDLDLLMRIFLSTWPGPSVFLHYPRPTTFFDRLLIKRRLTPPDSARRIIVSPPWDLRAPLKNSKDEAMEFIEGPFRNGGGAAWEEMNLRNLARCYGKWKTDAA